MLSRLLIGVSELFLPISPKLIHNLLNTVIKSISAIFMGRSLLDSISSIASVLNVSCNLKIDLRWDQKRSKKWVLRRAYSAQDYATRGRNARRSMYTWQKPVPRWQASPAIRAAERGTPPFLQTPAGWERFDDISSSNC